MHPPPHAADGLVIEGRTVVSRRGAVATGPAATARRGRRGVDDNQRPASESGRCAPNSIAPGKRPLNNLAPMIVSLPDREVALGTRGGRPIVNVCAQLAHRFVDGGWTASRVLAAPRLHASDREPLVFLEFAFTDRVAQEILDGLAAMGHRVRRQHEEVEGAGAAHCVELLTGEHAVRASGDTWAAGIAE